ncbi:MAG: DEAD/DEAH box helicase [Parachlamydiaceae bacterium]
MSNFSQFGLDESILKALEKINFTEPSPIQSKTIPLILDRRDVIALAQTGSGKTAACAIPICQLVNAEFPHIQTLIVVPTRELALQYATETQKIGLNKGVKAFAIFGGESAGMQQSKLKHGVQVLVATPGRLIDFIYSRDIDLTHVKTLVLDEADEMLSMGFSEDLNFVMQCLVHEHQTLLFSATMPKLIKDLAMQYMKNPEEIVLTSETKTPEHLLHHFLYCRHDKRITSLIHQMKEQNPKQSIIFCHSRIEVEKVCRELQKEIEGVDFFHAGLSQEIRTVITNKFRAGKIKHLVATDVVSRGLDFSGITHVFIYHLGDDPDIYVHRAGRTGRYDKTGVVITLVTDRELRTLKEVLKAIKKEPLWIGEPPPERAGSMRPHPSAPSTHRHYRSKPRPKHEV